MRSKDSQLSRIWLLSLGFFLFGGILVLKLYFIQVVYGEKYSQEADNQYYRTKTDIFERGSIYFKGKDGILVPAAIQKTKFSVSINPSVISDYDYHFEMLSSVIPIEKDTFLSKIKEKGNSQKIADDLDITSAESVRKLNLLGVDVKLEKYRFYPAGSLASHILGIVAYKENERAGRYGLERYYEDVLTRNSEGSFVNSFAEVFANVRDSVSSTNKEKREGDILLTIEPQAQLFLENELKGVNQKWGSEYSGGIIIDPSTGEIRAMAVNPSFNPNNFKDESDISIFSNPLVENVYEMGSIVKALTLASGIDSGTITPETTYFDAGFLVLNGKRISNFDGKGRGLVNMQEVLNNSLNTGAAFVANQMGKEKFSEYFFNFGFGQDSGIDLPNEASDIVGNLKSTREIEYATASFGQGIAVTPVTMTRALSALANGGILVNPRLVKEIRYEDGSSKEVTYGEGKTILKKETSEEITRMLVKTVDHALLGGTAKMENYSIAAKTGTAQVAKENERGYFEDKFLHTFFGYFPAFEPKFLVFLFTYNPREVRYASESMTHPFMNIARYLINYYSIPPDR